MSKKTKKARFSALLGRLTEFKAMTDGQRRAAGRQARQDAADAGYPNRSGHRTVTHADGRTSRIAMFSA